MFVFLFAGKTYINLTPHDIHIHTGDQIHTFPKSGYTVRLTEKHTPVDVGIPFPVFYKNFEGAVLVGTEKKEEPLEALIPFCEPGTFLIVSAFSVRSVLDLIIANSLKGVEVLVPDSGPKNVVRDEKGQIIGVKSFNLKRPEEKGEIEI